MSNNIKIFYQNTRGLRTKIASGLRNRISLANYHILCLTETWLCDKFESENIFDDSYVTHRADRNDSTYNKQRNTELNNTFVGGGSLIAIKKNISACRMKRWELEIPFDNVWLKLIPPEIIKFL